MKKRERVIEDIAMLLRTGPRLSDHELDIEGDLDDARAVVLSVLHLLEAAGWTPPKDQHTSDDPEGADE